MKDYEEQAKYQSNNERQKLDEIRRKEEEAQKKLAEVALKRDLRLQ